MNLVAGNFFSQVKNYTYTSIIVIRPNRTRCFSYYAPLSVLVLSLSTELSTMRSGKSQLYKSSRRRFQNCRTSTDNSLYFPKINIVTTAS